MVAGAGVTAVAEDRDAAFDAYVLSRKSSLLRTAYLLCGDLPTAEDLVQDALAKLYLSWHRVQRRESLDGYVRRIIVNEHHSLWRRAWKRREVATDGLPDARHEDVLPEPDVEARVWAVVRSLPPRQRAVVVLRYYEDLSEQEITGILGVSPGTVKSQASKALGHLRGLVEEVDR
jgi:RNA polymerase sigma-70 factor (sigma-E family)